MSDKLKLLAMEENLAGPDAAAYAKHYDRTLLLLKKRAQAEMDAGMEAQPFAAARLLVEAVDIARKIIKLTTLN